MNKEELMKKYNVSKYKKWYIGTEGICGEGRYITYLFDEEMNKLESALCDTNDMKRYIDYDKEFKNKFDKEED